MQAKRIPLHTVGPPFSRIALSKALRPRGAALPALGIVTGRLTRGGPEQGELTPWRSDTTPVASNRGGLRSQIWARFFAIEFHRRSVLQMSCMTDTEGSRMFLFRTRSSGQA